MGQPSQGHSDVIMSGTAEEPSAHWVEHILLVINFWKKNGDCKSANKKLKGFQFFNILSCRKKEQML